MTASRSRHDAQPAFVLHSYPFRETSLIIEVFACESGRVALVARGARRPRSALRGVLRAFQPLLLTWSGRSELRTLHKAEWHGSYAALSGLPLICGFYLNELLLKFLARDDPHERLFAVYQETLDALARGGESAAILRRFEKHLLRELGYGLILDRDADTGAPIAAESRYTYVVDRGPVVQPGDATGLGVELSGQTLIDMQSDNYTTVMTLQQSKALMRALINHYLGDRTLHTRQLLRDLRAL
ncbi:MAG TPA: DNA repair protein RecO [Burkholderiales bacterium]|nr:DNA repair protein RecO [Burkholderiales bacterium]